MANNGLLQTCIFLFSPVRSHHFAWPGIPLGRTVANELCKIKDNLDATENPEKMVPPTRPRAPSKVKARSYSIWSYVALPMPTINTWRLYGRLRSEKKDI